MRRVIMLHGDVSEDGLRLAVNAKQAVHMYKEARACVREFPEAARSLEAEERLDHVEATFDVDKGERLVEARTVTARSRKKKHVLHVVIFERTSRRGKKYRRAHIAAPGSVPIPGKGENSWDCGEDKVFGLHCAAKSVAEAVREFMRDIRETRRERERPRTIRMRMPKSRRRRRA